MGLAGCRLLVVLLAASGAFAQDPAGTDYAERLAQLQAEMGRLQSELETLQGEERGILGELERLGAELRLAETELGESALRLEAVTAEIERRDSALVRLDGAQSERRAYLTFRLREVYKAGPDELLQRLLAGEDQSAYWNGLRYAALLSERDARVLGAFQADAKRAVREREQLEETRRELSAVHAELAERRDAAATARRRRAAALGRIRRDGTQRRAALSELRLAAEELRQRAESLLPGAARPSLDVRRLKGTLDWPAPGELLAGFGSVVHPEFKTRVPHPGWDIAAPFGSSFVAVFDGEVLLADWMRGYGLTAIVDHGDGVLTIYAHASMLMAQAGDRVVRGQTLGKVGDTGSLRGPFLYFEIRIDGEPVDPATWLRQR